MLSECWTSAQPRFTEMENTSVIICVALKHIHATHERRYVVYSSSSDTRQRSCKTLRMTCDVSSSQRRYELWCRLIVATLPSLNHRHGSSRMKNKIVLCLFIKWITCNRYSCYRFYRIRFLMQDSNSSCFKAHFSERISSHSSHVIYICMFIWRQLDP